LANNTILLRKTLVKEQNSYIFQKFGESWPFWPPLATPMIWTSYTEPYQLHSMPPIGGARYHGGYHIQLQRGPGQVLRLPSLKHITVYNPDNDLIWEYETDCTRSASSDMRTFSPAVRM